MHIYSLRIIIISFGANMMAVFLEVLCFGLLVAVGSTHGLPHDPDTPTGTYLNLLLVHVLNFLFLHLELSAENTTPLKGNSGA